MLLIYLSIVPKRFTKGKIIAFIPTASLTEPIRFYVKRKKKALEEAGMIVEEVELPNCPKRKYLLYYINAIIST